MGNRAQRICFVLQVRQDRLDEYRERHAAVWPAMLDALSDSGWHNYSLFLGDDGLLVGYLETNDFSAAQARMSETDVNARWQAEMAPFFVASEGRPDESLRVLPLVFQLEDQRAASRGSSTESAGS